MRKGTFVRYSESFKLQVIRELEEGEHDSCNAAAQAYGIGSSATVSRWVGEYGREHLRRRVIRVEKPGERDELKRMKERVKQLERALGDTTLELRLEREFLKIACRKAGIEDVDEFKKKANMKQRIVW